MLVIDSKRKERKRAAPRVESLEPRLLYSADFLGVFAHDASAPDALPDWNIHDFSRFDDTHATHSTDADHHDDLIYSGPDSDLKSERVELVLIDGDVSDSQQLIDDLNAAGDRQILVHVLDKSIDGVEQISELLSLYSDLDAVHIVSHGSDSGLQIGNTWLDANSLDTYSQAISGWRDALDADADLMIYGCNLAASAEGQDLLGNLADLTGADIAASTDITGQASLGGDWDLEYHSGSIETAVAFSTQLQHDWHGILPINARETEDSDGDGQIDRIKITGTNNFNDDFSDLVITVSGYALDATTPYSTDTPGDNVFYVNLVESGSPDTDATPTVTVVANTMLKIAGAKVATDSGVVATDTAAPAIVARETADLNGDGFIDAMHVTFSEAISDATVVANDFDVTGVGNEAFNSTTNGDTADDADIYLTFDDGVFDSSATPNLTYTSDGVTDPNVQDLTGNLLADTHATAWWDSNWQNRDKITFDNSASGTNLTNFQILVTLTSAQIDYANTQDQGQDIRFVDADGTVLNYEIEKWDESGTSTVWVNVPQVDAGSTTDYIYMYYGNTGATDAQNPNGVWSNGYSAVWHLGEDPGPGGAGDIKDSTANGADLTADASMTSADLVGGQIGDALDFDGSDDILTTGTLTSTVTLTYEAWIKPTQTAGAFNTVLEFGDDKPWLGVLDNDKLSFWRGTKHVESTATISSSAFTHVVVTHEGTSLHMWINGVEDVAGAALSDTNTASGFRIGDSPTDDPFEGIIDEVRLSNVVRSADWIEAQYKSQSGTLDSLGGEETRGVTSTDATAPVATITRDDADPSFATSVTFSVDFSEAVSNVDATDFSLNLTGVSANSVVTVGDAGDADASTYTVTVDTIDGVGTLGIAFAGGNDITDLAANALNTTPVTSETYAIVNNAPTLSATGLDPTFTEGGGAADLFGGVTIDTVESGQTVDGLQFTVTNVLDGSGANELIVIDGENVALTNANSGTTAANGYGYSVSLSGSTATVTLTTTGTSVANAQTLVDSLSYINDSEDPTVASRVATLTSIQDSGGTANGGLDTTTLAVASTVNVNTVNDAPTLTATGLSPTFTEAGPAVDLFSGVTIDTVESGQTIDELQFTVSNVVDGSGANEIIVIDGENVALTNANSGTTAANGYGYSVSLSGTTATVTLTTTGTSVASAQTLIDGLAYTNDSISPTAGDRIATLTSIKDSGGTANGGVDTGALSVGSTVTVTIFNDPPTLTATGLNPTVTEGGAAGDLFSGVTIDTVESGQTIDELQFTVTNVIDGSGADEIIVIDGDSIALTDTNSGSTAANGYGYSVSLAGSTATVTLTTTGASVASAQTLVDGLAYQNTSQDPTTVDRVVTLTSVKDSGGTANGGQDTTALSIASTASMTIADFQQGTNSYFGTQDTELSEATPATALGNNPTLTTDLDTGGFESQGLIRFDNIFGGGPGQIPLGSTITSAVLTVTQFDPSDPAAQITLHRMLVNWDESSTWNSLTAGIQADDVEAAAAADAAVASPDVNGAKTISGLESTVQAWSNGATNYGWAILTDSTNGWDIKTSENGTASERPSLHIEFTPPSINDAPTLVATGLSPTFTEGGAAADLFSGVTIDTIEAGQTIEGITFEVTNVIDGSGANEFVSIDGENVALTNANSGTTAANGYGYSVSLSGTTATVTLTTTGASVASAQTLVDGLAYTNDSDDPTVADRVATLTSIQDSGGTLYGGVDTAALSTASIVTVNAVNDAPALTATGVDPTFTEGGTAADLFSGVTIDTVESGQAIDALQFTVTNVVDGSGANEFIVIDGENVALTNANSGTTAANGYGYSVSLSGSTATVTLTTTGASVASAQTLVDGLAYINDSDDPTAANRVATLTSIQDSGGTANGGVDTTTLSVASTVTVDTVNDAPALTVTGVNPTFTEGGAAADLFSGVTIDTIESGQTIDALQFTVTNVVDGAGANELIVIDGENVALTNANSGTTAANGYGYSVSLSGSTATVTLTTTGASVASAQTLVDGLAYTNDSASPTTGARVATLTSIQDSGGTANGGVDTTTLSAASTVTVDTVNDAPALTATGVNPTFTEGGAAADLFSGVTIDTVESGQTIEAITFEVTNVIDGSGANELIVIDGENVALTNANSGTTAANGYGYSVSLSGSTATVTLTTTGASVASAQSLVDGLAYTNDSANPTTGVRVATLTSIQDSGGKANGGVDTTTLSVASTVTVDTVNDAPTLTATGVNPTFTEGGLAADLFSGVTIDTVEAGQTVEAITFEVTNVVDGAGANEFIVIDGENVALTNANSGTTAANGYGYSVSLSGSTATVTLTTTGASVASAQALVDGLAYINDSDNPTVADRIATLTGIQDSGGTANGGVDTTTLSTASTVALSAVNDAPTVVSPIADQSASTGSLFSFTLPPGVFADVDSPTLTLSATLADNSALPAWLSFDPVTQTFSGTPAGTDVGSYAVKVVADDGSGGTVADTFGITVTGTGGSPVISGATSGSVTEDDDPDGDGLLAVTGTLTVVDPDPGESGFVAGTVTGAFGSMSVDTGGTWNYTADNSQIALQQLDVGESVTDSFTLTTLDGTGVNVVVTIDGAEDAAVVEGTVGVILTEDTIITATGVLTIADVDVSDNPVSFQAETGVLGDAGLGTFTLSNGVWTYSLRNGSYDVQNLEAGEFRTDTHDFVASDGTIQRVSVAIEGTADPETANAPVADWQAQTATGGTVEPTPGANPAPVTSDDSTASDTAQEEESGLEDRPAGLSVIGSAPQQLAAVDLEEILDVYKQTLTTAEDHEQAPDVIAGDNAVQYANPIKVNESVLDRFIDLQNLDLNQIQLRNVQLTELTEVVRSDSFYKSLDELGDNLSESFSDMDVRSQLGVASVVGVVLSASASIFGQLLRAGSLLASFLSVVPLWRQFDPLPILVATDEEKKKKRIRFLGGKKDEDEDKEEDEVEELFDHDQEKGDRR